MELSGVKVGFGLTGSYCTLEPVIQEISNVIKEGGEAYPIISPGVDHTNTRFGEAIEWKQRLVQITGNKLINSIVLAEPIGPQGFIDVLVIAPCTGNTLAKLANGITDTPVLMAAKAHLRNERPVIIGLSTNDALGMNAKNLGVLLNAKNIYFIPFAQDNPYKKPNSVISKMGLIIPTVKAAMESKQLQPILVPGEE